MFPCTFNTLLSWPLSTFMYFTFLFISIKSTLLGWYLWGLVKHSCCDWLAAQLADSLSFNGGYSQGFCICKVSVFQLMGGTYLLTFHWTSLYLSLYIISVLFFYKPFNNCPLQSHRGLRTRKSDYPTEKFLICPAGFKLRTFS